MAAEILHYRHIMIQLADAVAWCVAFGISKSFEWANAPAATGGALQGYFSVVSAGI